MMNVMFLFYLLVFLLVPALVLYVVHHQVWAQKLGVVLSCYLLGLLCAQIGIVPAAAIPVQQGLSDAAVALALPMLLFSLDIRQWSKVASRAMLSMLFATVAVVTLATTLFHIFRGDGVESTSQLAAMSVGLYTGGTPNLAAIKTALAIPHERYIVFHSLDTVIGGLYLLMMLTMGVPLFRRLLGTPEAQAVAEDGAPDALDEEEYSIFLQRENWLHLGQVLTLGALVLATALGLSALVGEVLSVENTSALTIVFLTTLGMALSLIGRVRALTLSYRTGMYLIYVFCFAVASMTNLDDLASVSLSIAVFVLGSVLGSVVLHALLCRLAGIDGDTFIVTSVAAICSPPFVPMLVKALGNPGLMLSGMTTGIIGYALGNYLGIGLALFLQS